MRLFGSSVVLAVVFFLACSDADGPRDGRLAGGLRVEAAALLLQDVLDVCYGLTVTTPSDTVWSQSGICADDYGNGEGAITYIGPCDASEDENGEAWNTVTLVVESVELAQGDDGTWENPCPAPNGCAQTIDCQENADVLVTFNLVLMRSAEQGFFDIAVDFEDVFCSAKLDCVDELLHQDCGARVCGQCGDGVCEGGEGASNCKQDCYCGDGVCSFDELGGGDGQLSRIDEGDLERRKGGCIEDCGFCGDGYCAESENAVDCYEDCQGFCGNGVCEGELEEDASWCEDCGSCGDDVCTPGELIDCDDECTCGDGTCDDAAGEGWWSCTADCPYPWPVCGDGVCEDYENAGWCSDCVGVCGDAFCEDGEDCAADCTCGNGVCDDPMDYNNNCGIECSCGDEYCDRYGGEDPTTCASDCYCGNLTCDAGETKASCAEDGCECGDGTCSLEPGSYWGGEYDQGCGYECTCGDGWCDTWYGEDQVNCVADCGACGDGNCDMLETLDGCWGDCGVLCGNGGCDFDHNETFVNCAVDCEAPCGNGACDDNETFATCAEDCIFCTGPDCEGASGSRRTQTTVLALACTAGEDSNTTLNMNEVIVACDDGWIAIDPSAGPGMLIPSVIPPNPIVYQAATYQGVEQLGDYNKVYNNIALGVFGEDCNVTWQATVSDGAFEGGFFPEDWVYPYVDMNATLTGDGGALACGSHPLGSPEVQIRYRNPWDWKRGMIEAFSVYCGLEGCGAYSGWREDQVAPRPNR